MDNNKEKYKKAQEIADSLIKYDDKVSILSRVDEAMNKGLKWGIVYIATDMSKMLTNSDDVDDIICAYRDLEAKIKELLS